jgi:mono/diheme cytochrome c family protein
MDLILAIVLATALTGGSSPVRLEAGTHSGTHQGNDAGLQTTLDRVFTADQAERGQSAYALNCSSCHSEDLQGMNAPALMGQQFVDTWRQDSVSSLFDLIRTRMPPRGGGSLDDQTYLDILTHILSINGFPAGPEELTTRQVESVRFVGLDGPTPLPEFSLVQVVGCLQSWPEGEWALTKVSAPVRTRDPEGLTDEQLQTARDMPLGTLGYRLVYMDFLRPGFQPEPHVGHKVHAKGYLLRNDRGIGLSLTRLDAVATSCGD